MPELTENLIRLRSAPGIGNATVWRLIRHFGSADAVLSAPPEALASVKGLTPEKRERIRSAARFDPRPEMERAAQAGIDILPYDDPGYPQPLLHTFDPPLLLYVRGALTREDMVAVGIVGTRRTTPYGRDSALELSALLARGGYTIVSGLARGIDTFAHIGAMNAGGRTVGVLGCGFDHMYPEENRDLALEMSSRGAVISEFPMAAPPTRETFPMRNRIIAGMALGLLVIEAPLRSGSLITARIANEIGRSVFAVPGRVGDPGAEGCNKLIRDGATMVMSVDDIFTELNPSLPLPRLPNPRDRKKKRQPEPEPEPESKPEPKPKAPKKAPPPPPAAPELDRKPNPRLSAEQAKILSVLTGEWQNADAICAASGLPAGKVVAALAMLKIMRLAEQNPGQMYKRK